MEISKVEIASAAAASSEMGNQSQELMGAEVLIKSLQAEGVKYIWGYPGGAVLYIYDALYKQDTMQQVLCRIGGRRSRTGATRTASSTTAATVM